MCTSAFSFFCQQSQFLAMRLGAFAVCSITLKGQNKQLCFHEHSFYLFSENKHPYVARQEPPILEPSYVLNHFPDINCPMNVILKKMDESPEGASSNGLEEIAAAVLVQEHVAELECLLLPPTEAFHAIIVENNYPKVLFRKKDHTASMTAEAAQFYEEKVQCANVLRLCALTKGQSKISGLCVTLYLQLAQQTCISCTHYVLCRWHQERRVRVTCSMAHSILRTRKSHEDLVKDLMQPKIFSCDATRHGTAFRMHTSHY